MTTPTDPTNLKWTISYDADSDVGLIDVIREDELDSHVSQRIQFQHGPVLENGVNGIQNEQLIQLLQTRIDCLDLRFPCEENKQAVAHLAMALGVLEARTRKRREQGVEGKNEAHTS